MWVESEFDMWHDQKIVVKIVKAGNPKYTLAINFIERFHKFIGGNGMHVFSLKNS